MSLITRWAAALCLAAGPAWALYTESQVTAYQVPDGSIVVDGVLDDAWKTIARQDDGVEVLSLF